MAGCILHQAVKTVLNHRGPSILNPQTPANATYPHSAVDDTLSEPELKHIFVGTEQKKEKKLLQECMPKGIPAKVDNSN